MTKSATASRYTVHKERKERKKERKNRNNYKEYIEAPNKKR
jgi:hypothetical protein